MVGALPHNEPAAFVDLDDPVGDQLVTASGVFLDVRGAAAQESAVPFPDRHPAFVDTECLGDFEQSGGCGFGGG
jgi:hypothetical protein